MNPLTRSFRDMHAEGCFILPNPWDATTARLLVGCGFMALASTSSGYAHATGRKDGHRHVARDEAVNHAAALSRATGLPVTLDAEDGWADMPDGVAETVAQAAAAGLAGVSIEDRDTLVPGRMRDFAEAVERVEAAVAAARDSGMVVTARADGFGNYDLVEVIRRLKAFAEIGADVVYAPGLPDLAAIGAVCRAVEVPVNHVLGLGAQGLSFADLAGAGVRRISLGGSFTRAALGRIAELARELQDGDFTAFDAAPGWSDLPGSRLSL